ncbi:MAG: exodeoxyribonuclease small subunit [Chloroflexota bacterium]|jgi:exodeoxyribonuclease VII small subunit|nr:exodeoxyribonuclease small subunit [Chloroflexota bacterium]MEA2606420.1 exodeoxyribonuclease small subunit [Chloroflexota bacterium]
MTADQAAPDVEPGSATPAADPAIAALSFDDAFAELRAAVAELEAGGLALEDTIARTERAVALQRHCEKLLGEAELRVRQLVNRPGGGLEARDIAADEATEG